MWILENAKDNLDGAAAAAVPYLEQCASVAGGYMMARMAKSSHDLLQDGADENEEFLKTKLLTSRFFAESLLPQVNSLTDVIKGGHVATLKIANEQF